jgi:hypothetical protein
MEVTGCTDNDYQIYSGNTPATIHPVWTDGDGNTVVMCDLVKLGGNGVNS